MLRFLAEGERVRRLDCFLSHVQSVRAVVVEREDAHSLSREACKLLVKAALEPGTWLTNMYSALDLSPADGKRAMDELLALGYVKLHRLPKGRGGQPTIAEVLPDGVAELATRGIVPAEQKVRRGGFKHDVYARYVEIWARARGWRCWFERTLGEKAFDVVLEDEEGSLRAVEIYLSGTIEWVAEHTLKGVAVSGVKEVIVACERKAFVELILAKLRALDALGLYRKKVVGKLLSEYLPA